MQNPRRALIAALVLLAVAGWLERAAPLIRVETRVVATATPPFAAPATAQAALDLGVLGTVAINWTLQRFD